MRSGRRAVRLLGVAAVGAAGALVAVLATGGVARTAPAPAPAVTKETHLGSVPKDHVVLTMSGTTTPRRFRRLLANGTLEATPYVVPNGAALLVTDVEWAGGWPHENRGPWERVLRLQVVNDADTAKRGTVAYVAPLAAFVNPDDGTRVYDTGNWRSATGFVVGAGARLEADAPEDLDGATGDPVAGPFHGDVVVRGYLVRDR